MIYKKFKIVFCAPALYLSGGVERVLSLKANYFAEKFGYDITIILTDGKGKPNAFPLSDKIRVINLDINFEELWFCPFYKKIFVYLRKQRQYKRLLTAELMKIRPDITDSLLRREINFLTKIKDGSKKIGELHVSKNNFRTFKDNETSFLKELFSKYWRYKAVISLKKLDKFIVLTEEDKTSWTELENVVSIPNPISFETDVVSCLKNKRVLAVGRYDYVKGYDLLLKAWKKVEGLSSDWCLDVFGAGDRTPYEELLRSLNLNQGRCHLNGATSEIMQEYLNSSIFVLSSRFEGLSMSLLEAMSCGLPVVSFACPCGPKDVIRDGENGFLVEREDINMLADYLLKLINNPSEITRMAKNAKRRSADFYIEVLAERWRVLFENLFV